jgi:hypothetical protein
MEGVLGSIPGIRKKKCENNLSCIAHRFWRGKVSEVNRGTQSRVPGLFAGEIIGEFSANKNRAKRAQL